MNQPTVCAICLTADRPELAKRAVECFRAQTYPHKRLLIWDSGDVLCPELEAEDDGVYWVPVSIEPGIRNDGGETIGHMRNTANAFWTEYPIIVHWDDDDWSHPARIAEQVALLESSGAEAVGYNEMLFWREDGPIERTRTELGILDLQRCGEAWMYRGTILGTSLCYWRTTWERRKFEATSYGEDTKWLMGVRAQGVRAFHTALPDCQSGDGPEEFPRMVARIHGKNTSKAYDVKSMLAAPNHWTRTPHWDAYCKGVCE